MSNAAELLSNYRTACRAFNVSEWQTHAAAGRKVEAIKAVRFATNFGLKDSKDIVDTFIANNYPFSTVNEWFVTKSPEFSVKVIENLDGTFTVVKTTTSSENCANARDMVDALLRSGVGRAWA